MSMIRPADRNSVRLRRFLDPMRPGVLPLIVLAGALATPAAAPAAFEPRIVGGAPTAAGANPAQASLRVTANGSSFLCAGTLVAPTKIVTAAHCLDGPGFLLLPIFPPAPVAASAVEVFLGSDTVWSGTRQVASGVELHPDYDRGTSRNDVAVVTLPAAAPETPMPLADPATDSAAYAPGAPATVLGWGRTSEGGSQSSTLLGVEVPIVSDEVCNSPQGYAGGIDGAVHICAGLPEGGKDACQGDSGGPLLVNAAGVRKLVGVVSTGEGCAQPNKPGIYTELPAAGIRSFVVDAAGLRNPAPAPTTSAPAVAAPAPSSGAPSPAPNISSPPRPTIATRIATVSVRSARGALTVSGRTSGTACREGRVRVTTYRGGRLLRRTLTRPSTSCRFSTRLSGGGRLKVAIAFVPTRGRTLALKSRTRVVR